MTFPVKFVGQYVLALSVRPFIHPSVVNFYRNKVNVARSKKATS